MSELDALLARSREPGRVTNRRRFTLARERAIEKMREFTLRHPAQYLLEVIQGAVLSGATWVAVDVTEKRAVIGWVGGRPISPEQAEHLFDALFFDQADAKRRHLMQLAVGVNALLQRRPSQLWLESGDGTAEGTVRLSFNPDGTAEVGRPDVPLAGTYLVVEFSTMAWFPRFFGTSVRVEREQIESRCLYTPVPILLNGSAPFGYRANRDTRLFGVPKQYAVGGEGRRGAVAPAVGEMTAELRLVVGGVWVASRQLDKLLDARVVGVVIDDSLRKTADMSDIVEDDRYFAALHAVVEALRPAFAGRKAAWKPTIPEPIAPASAPAATAVAAPTAPRVVRQPLPDPIPQVGARPSLSAALLADRGEGAPLFVVDEDVALRLGAALDPLAFPWPVLVLSEGQTATLSDLAPRLVPSRLRGAPDIAFIDRVMLQHQRVQEVRFSVPFGPDASLRLRLHQHGPLPDWGLSAPGVPVAVVSQGAVVTVFAAGVDVPGVSAVLDLGSGLFAAHALEAVAAHIADNLWRLLPKEAVDRRDPTWRPLLTTILALHARPFLVQTVEGVRLSVALPERWAASDLLRLPLADTPEGPLTAGDFVATLGQDVVKTVLDPGDRAALRALERRLGHGHLRGPAESPRALAGVGRRGGVWHSVRAESIGDPSLEALLWVQDGFDAALEDPTWRPLPVPLALVGGAAREGIEVDAGSLHHGYALLYGRCVEHWSAARHGDRARLALFEVAVFALARWLGRPPPRVLDTTGALVPDLQKAKIIAANGVHIAERGTVALSYDAVRALLSPDLEGRPARPLHLRLDDAPEVWSATADPGPSGWLVRRPVRFGLVSGWIGLRRPFDGSMGVLLEDVGGLRVFDAGDVELPFHGWLWDESGGAGLGPQLANTLATAGTLVYDELIAGLRGAWTAEERSCALAYAEAYVEAWLAQHGALPASGVPRTLATLVGLHATGDAATRAQGWVQRAVPVVEAPPPCLDAFADALRSAWAPLLPALHVRVRAESELGELIVSRPASEAGGMAFAVWKEHALVRRALAGERLAQELLLIAACVPAGRQVEMVRYRRAVRELQALILARPLAGLAGWAPAAAPPPGPGTKPPPRA